VCRFYQENSERSTCCDIPLPPELRYLTVRIPIEDNATLTITITDAQRFSYAYFDARVVPLFVHGECAGKNYPPFFSARIIIPFVVLEKSYDSVIHTLIFRPVPRIHYGSGCSVIYVIEKQAQLIACALIVLPIFLTKVYPRIPIRSELYEHFASCYT